MKYRTFELWGNYGDGKWRASWDDRLQENIIEPADTIEHAKKSLDEKYCIKKYCMNKPLVPGSYCIQCVQNAAR